MDSKIILKYKKYSIPQLLGMATRRFNKFIRERDKDDGCISCGKQIDQAGHFYSAGKHPELRYHEFNVNGQETYCNKHLSGNLNEYRRNLEKKIGLDELKKLDETADYWKCHIWHWDRFYLIEIIEKYK